MCPVSSAIFCPYLRFLFGAKGMTIVFGPNLQVLWVLSLVLRVVCPSTYLCFSSVFSLGAGTFSSSANGEPMVTLERSSVAPFIFVFPSGLSRLCFFSSKLCLLSFFTVVLSILISREAGFDSLAKLAGWLRMEGPPPILAVFLPCRFL